MLVAISHDLRTSITRMKLRAQFVEDLKTKEALTKVSALNEMEAMINETLAFTRGDYERRWNYP